MSRCPKCIDGRSNGYLCGFCGGSGQMSKYQATLEKAADQLVAFIKEDMCPNHKIPITKKQVGKCVYAKECGCRLYQGKLQQEQSK